GDPARIARVLEIAPPRVSHGEEAAREELPQTGRGGRHQGLGICGRVSPQCGAESDGRAEREAQVPHAHSAAKRGEMVPEPAGERDGAAVQDHLNSGDQVGAERTCTTSVCILGM
ncbi:MAG: hypothetical protein ACK55Z_16015, partial [bacterium]